MQEQYAQHIGVHTAGMQMSDAYSIWSATTTIQLLSVHTRDIKEYRKYLGTGQKARFWYAPRPKKEKEDTYVDSDLGVLTELQKQLVSMHKWMRKDTGSMSEIQKVQHEEHKASLIAEVARLITKLPAHEKMGIKEMEKARYTAAARHMANFNEEQIKQIILRSQSFINFRLTTARKEDSEAITDWIEDILDASQGYKKAHTWTRGTSKAPPLPTHMWKKGKYIGHPHDMGKYLLEDWRKVWTQENSQGMPLEL